MQEPFVVKKVAVLGAGVMGAQIAAHCVNAGIATLLFDLASEKGDSNALVAKAIANLTKLKPFPLGTLQTASLLQAKNYKENLADLTDCLLIIEAIAERIDWKEALYREITPYLNDSAVLVSNTSGLSINALSAVLPEACQQRFCGVHFFNPPRYMHLAELIPAKTTTPKLLEQLETWLTSYLGKGVVCAKDTPNFIANRIGVFSLLATLHHAEKMGFGLDLVDALTGTLIGRPKSATFRTMDVVGLDTMEHVVNTMKEQLESDPWHPCFALPHWFKNLIKEGNLGQKVGQGIYRKKGQVIEVFVPNDGNYQPVKAEVAEELKAILKIKEPRQRMQALISSANPQAQFLLACYRDLFHYCAYHLEEIADTVRDVDLAIRWGFGWEKGPFETWQLVNVADINRMLEEGIAEKKTLSFANLPAWLTKIQEFYRQEGAYSPFKNGYVPRSQLAVYRRQFFLDPVLNERHVERAVLYENEGVKLWHLKEDVAVLNFKSKANTISKEVLEGIAEALNKVEGSGQGLIFYQHDANNFSAGANLFEVANLIKAQKMTHLEVMLKDLQELFMRIKYSAIPTVAALRGRALGGGCELLLHCHSIVAAFESYPGLVEASVGLIPAGGGCKEMALRAAEKAQGADLLLFIQPVFQQIATAAVASSAAEAKQKGYLRDRDYWLMHRNEVLFAAFMQVKALQVANYQPPLATTFRVAGREGHARLEVGLVNWLAGGYISQHDYFLANQLAKVICGGDVNEGQRVDEAWILKLEREAFMTLAASPLSQARINYMLEKGKALHN